MRMRVYACGALLICMGVGVGAQVLPKPVEPRQQTEEPRLQTEEPRLQIEHLAKENARIILGQPLVLTDGQRIQLYKTVYPNLANSWVGAIRQAILCASLRTQPDPTVCNAQQLAKIRMQEAAFKPHTLMEVTRYKVTQDQLMTHYANSKQPWIQPTQDSPTYAATTPQANQQTSAGLEVPETARAQATAKPQNLSVGWLITLCLGLAIGIAALLFIGYSKRKRMLAVAADTALKPTPNTPDLTPDLTPQQSAYIDWYHTLKRCHNLLQGLNVAQLKNSAADTQNWAALQPASHDLLQFLYALEAGIDTAKMQRSSYGVDLCILDAGQTDVLTPDTVQCITDTRLALLHAECITLKGMMEKNDLKNTALYHWTHLALHAVYTVSLHRASCNSKPRFMQVGATLQPYVPAPVTVANAKPVDYLTVVSQSIKQQVQYCQTSSAAVCA